MSSRGTERSNSRGKDRPGQSFNDHKTHKKYGNHQSRGGNFASPENHDSRQQSGWNKDSKKFENYDHSGVRAGSSYNNTNSGSSHRNSDRLRPFTMTNFKNQMSQSNMQPAAETTLHTKSGTLEYTEISPDVKDENQSDSNGTNDMSGGGEKKGKRRSSKSSPRLKEVTGDLFTAKDNVSLVHCVGADFRMGSGIAVKFREEFDSVGELLDQRVGPGGVAFLKRGLRYVFYLVTKQASKDKPTNDTMRQSLIALHDKCKELNVTELAMPQIGCGLDGFLWKDVEQMLLEIFTDGITITVHVLGMDAVCERMSASKARVENHKFILKDIEKGTGFLYIGCADMSVTDEMKSLNEEYPFLQSLRKCSVGSVFQSKAKGENIYGLTCKKSANSPLSYDYLEAALKDLNGRNATCEYYYFGIQAFEEKDDPYVMEKIDTLLRNSLTDVQVWICWPPLLAHKCPSKLKEEQENMEVDKNPDLSKTVQQSGLSKSNLYEKSTELRNSDNQYGKATIEVEQKMTAQSLTDEANSWEEFVDKPLPEVVKDASNTSDSNWTMKNQLPKTPAEADNWQAGSSWNDSEFRTEVDEAMSPEEYAAAEKRKSREKKEANQLMREKEKQDRRSVRSKSCVTEYQGDLFEVDDSISLAHCVGADFRMGSGIAVIFRQNFGSIPALLNQRVSQGGVAVIRHEKRHIFYLVTKKESTGKPTYDTMERSLHALHKKCKELNITELAMPRIGCGLDRLSWERVKPMIEGIFSDGFSIRVYNIDKDYQETQKSKSKTNIKIEAIPLKHIERGTALICIGSEDMFITEEMKSLDSVYRFLMRLDKGKKVLGTVVAVEAQPHEIVYILICKKNAKDPLDYVAMHLSIKQLQKLIKKQGYNYMGIQAFVDKRDPGMMAKIETMFRYSYIPVDVWICYPPEMKDLMCQSSSRKKYPHPSNGEKKSCRQTSINYQSPGVLQDMQLMLESINSRLCEMDEKLKKAIVTGESKTEQIMNQTSSEIHELRETILSFTTKMESWEPSHICEWLKNLEERLNAQEADNRSLKATIENLEQRLQKQEIVRRVSSSTHGAGQLRLPYKSNRGHPCSGYPSASPSLLHNLPPTQVFPSIYYPGRSPVFQPMDNEMHEHYEYTSPADFSNQNPNYATSMIAVENIRYERDALLRTTQEVARLNGYKVTERDGNILVRKDDYSEPVMINSYDDLQILNN